MTFTQTPAKPSAAKAIRQKNKEAYKLRLRFGNRQMRNIMKTIYDYSPHVYEELWEDAMRGAPEHALGSDEAIRAKFDRPSHSGRQPENLCTCSFQLCGIGCFCDMDDIDDNFRESLGMHLFFKRLTFEERTRRYFAKLEAEEKSFQAFFTALEAAEVAGREERQRTLQFRLGVALAVVCSALAVVVP